MWEDDINQVVKPRASYQRFFHQKRTHFPFSQEEPIMCFCLHNYPSSAILKEMDLLGFEMCFALIGKNSGSSNLIWKDINFQSLCRHWLVMSAKKSKYYF